MADEDAINRKLHELRRAFRTYREQEHEQAEELERELANAVWSPDKERQIEDRITRLRRLMDEVLAEFEKFKKKP